MALHGAAGDRHLHFLSGFRIFIDNGALGRVPFQHGDLQHCASARTDGQERRIGGAAFRPQGWQDDVHHLVVNIQHLQQRLIQAPGLINLRGADEFIVKSKLVEELAQACIVVMCKALILIGERVGHLGQRFPQIGRHGVLIGHIVGHLAQGVHVVRKANQTGWNVRQNRKGVAHHGCA